MSIRKKITALALGGSILLGMAGTAMAAQAVATGNVNVRTGPSTQYQRVDTLRRGDIVNIASCRDSWCYVEKNGPDGWVSASYLQRASAQPQYNKPSTSFSFSFGTFPRPQPQPQPQPPRPPRHDGGWQGGHDNGGWNNGGWNGHGSRGWDWNH